MDENTSKKKSGKDRLELPRDGRKRGYTGDDGKGQYTRGLRGGFIWIILFLITLFTVSVLWNRDTGQAEVSYTVLREQIDAGNIATVLIDGKDVRGELKQAVPAAGEQGRSIKRFKVWLPAEDSTLPDKIWEKNPGIEVKSKGEKSNWGGFLLTTFVPILFLVGIMILLMRQMEAGGNRAFSFGRSRAKMIISDRPKVTFEDVAGADEAKEELEEVIEFLRDPRKFQKLGGRIPKGALLLGAPGTGKTLLARAVAGEAGVPFFSISGSDFVEMFVGVGASRVRDLFDQGKKHAPCIIFIDEIDAVGRHRGAGLGGGHDEREQTLNQLLVEMDGFESNEGVILLAATNRPDVLDPALLRPGRFDRQIVVDMPDVNGREGILKVHTRKIPLGENVELKVIARGTPGLSGADLASIVNEAALLAARKNQNNVTMSDFEEARDKVMMGPERKSLLLNEEERKLTAFHEAGHALVASMIPGADPLHKVTIVPRGRALGLTTQIPLDDKHSFSKSWLMGRITVALGGRAAEKIVFNDLTSGAQEDIEKASTIARKMVCEWGMSEAVGPLALGPKEEQIFLGREIAQHRDYSEQTAVLIDREVRVVVDEALARSEKIVADNVDKLKDLAAALLEREILDREEIEKVLRGEKLPAPVREPSANARNAKRAAAKAAGAAAAAEAAAGAGGAGGPGGPAEVLPAPEGLFGQPERGTEPPTDKQAR
ncbi:MAG: ATP-dependent zinc metalloprotease FtsH [bacterium]